MLTRSEAISSMNDLGSKGVPFFMFTDFKGEKVFLKRIDELDPEELTFSFHENPSLSRESIPFHFTKHPVSYEEFLEAFNKVTDEIHQGNSYLVNLTFKTPIETSLSLSDIYRYSQAKYKVKYKDQFVVFSPETFVSIKNNYIYSHPMKGTIDASIPNAESIILSDPKETAEHVTIVDLIRNDISQVSEHVEVTNFRYISTVYTHEKSLLQVSSEIRGQLEGDYLNKLGSMLFSLLPAGSISGAPKNKTVSIIEEAETYDRGFYTGICGYFDGKDFESAVMIRFIENENGQFFFKSGGGITSFSDPKKEYQELIDKIYAPIY